MEKRKLLTNLEKKILQFIGDYLRKRPGESPTLAEIGDGCGIKSVGTVHRYVSSLKKKRYLKKGKTGWRTIKAPSELPYRGRIVAGEPLEAIEQEETIDLMEKLVQPDCFLLDVKGDSMIEKGIFDGDMVIVRRSDIARDGDIVVALVDGIDASLKEFRRRSDGKIDLIPHNEDMEPMTFDAEQVIVQGVLRSVIRMY